MKKTNPIKHNKIWGYEIWLHSPLKGFETFDDNGNKTTSGPLLKIIKTKQPLSVQVHPDDKLAKELENEPNGKSESWYILKSASDSELVMGLKNFDEKVIRNGLDKKTFTNLLLTKQAKKGEFYDIPAGLVHGIGANLTIFELQQPSDITYRYFDYNRKDKSGNYRELHIDKAIKSQKSLNYELKPLALKPLIYKNEVAIQEFHNAPSILKQKSLVVDLENFVCYKANAGDKANFKSYVVVHSFKE